MPSSNLPTISLKIILAFALGIFIPISTAYSLAPQESFAPIVEMTTPAVVSIATVQNIKTKDPLEEFVFSFPDAEHYEILKEFMEKTPGYYDSKKQKASSLGSGFLIDADGYIITNYHIISGANEVNVTLADNPDKTYKAKILGSDAKTDLALLKIEGKNFPFIKLGDSDKAKVGDWVIVIGTPFGLTGTVTAGIISAKARVVPGLADDFIQTDASINFGNSGGPMINLQGEVIGISSAILTPSLGNVGIGLTIPSNVAVPIIKQLKEKGAVIRGWLGVKIHPISEEIAKNLGLKDTKGALVQEVIKDGPADKIGLKFGDVIVKLNEQDIVQAQKLPSIVAPIEIGKKVNIEYLRDGKVIQSTVQIEKLMEPQGENLSEPVEKKETFSFLGIRVDNLNPLYRQKLRLDNKAEGVVITKVNRGSPAALAGILPGDIILRVNKTNILTITELEKNFKEAQKHGSKSVLLLINRAGSNLFVVIPFE